MFTSTSPDYLKRSSLWSSQLKDILLDELQAQKYVQTLSEFPDGDTFNIPSVGQFQVDNYVEDTPIKYRSVDTGNFQFTITEYMSGAYYVTNKALQDSFYMSQVMSLMPQKMQRALMQNYENKVMDLANSQTANDLNLINGAPHRWVGSGTNETMSVNDFAKALYSLKKANVPATNLIAIVDPSVEYAINTLTNITNVSNNPKWEGIIGTGMADATGMRFVKNIFGFDVYVSNYLADANETISGKTTTAGKANMFFSAQSDILPFIGAWRQMPKVESSYNKDFQREEYVMTARYGLKLYRPENLVVVLTDTDQV